MAVSLGVGAAGYLLNGTGGDHATTDPPVTTQATGSAVVLFAGVRWVATESSAPVDNKSNTYTQHGAAMTYPNYTESGTFCWTNMSVVGGASHTWTKYCVLDSETTILAAEIIGGTAASDLVDYTHAAAGVNGTYVSPSITVAEEAVILCAFFGEGYFTANPSAPGWTLVCTFNGTQESVQGALFARHVDGAGSYSCTINTTGDSQAALMRLVAVTGAADVLIEAPWYTMA